MGYHLHIHRADEWHHADRRPVTADEWAAVVASDPELRLDAARGPHLAFWAGPCRSPGGTWFNWLDGRVFTKNPDRAVLAKMLELARRLGARVQGAHGEFYNRPEDMPGEEEFAASRRPWWRFWYPTGGAPGKRFSVFLLSFLRSNSQRASVDLPVLGPTRSLTGAAGGGYLHGVRDRPLRCGLMEGEAMTRCGWFGGAGVAVLAVLALFAGGCSNKSGRAGKVEVVVSDRLKQKGVSLVDWRYSESQKSFGVKLKAASPVEKQTYLVISGPGIGRAGSPTPAGDSINKGEWIDFGGTKALGNPFDNFPQSGTITIDAR